MRERSRPARVRRHAGRSPEAGVWYSIHIQITIDELLKEFDASAEAQSEGRSAVLRQALREYLVRMRREKISRQYERAYARDPGLGAEFSDWEEQNAWPDE